MQLKQRRNIALENKNNNNNNSSNNNNNNNNNNQSINQYYPVNKLCL